MLATSSAFKENARRALADPGLQKALVRSRPGFAAVRAAGAASLPEFEDLRERAKAIKNHMIANIDFYLEHYAAQVEAKGGWCIGAGTPRRRGRRFFPSAGA